MKQHVSKMYQFTYLELRTVSSRGVCVCVCGGGGGVVYIVCELLSSDCGL